MVALRDSMMYECRVLYIGSAPPIETLKGVEALQEPLNQRYPDDLGEVAGIDANLRVLPTELEITYMTSGEVVNFPLTKLSICAGVRAVNIVDGATGQQSRQFAPVNTVSPESKHPAIFAAIIRRSKGRQIAECHMYICNSTRDALHLVNAVATANIALRERGGRTVRSTKYNNDVIVVRAGIGNEYDNGGFVGNGDATKQAYEQSENDTIMAQPNISQMAPKSYQMQQPTVEAPKPEVIYISFDKSNLVETGENTMKIEHAPRHTRRSETPTRIAYDSHAQHQVYYDDMPPERPYVDIPNYTLRPTPPPQPPMHPIMMPRPVLMRAPPPPMMTHPQQRMFTTRAIPPPRPMFVPQHPMHYNVRRRSASPVYGGQVNSEVRMHKKDEYQPKWRGAKSDIVEHRISRREQYEQAPPPPRDAFQYQGPPRGVFQHPGPPRDFRQQENMFLNERAFARRIHADDRISKGPPVYHYPTAVNLHEAMLYDIPTAKSNPGYSSSSSSSSEDRNSPRRRAVRR